jgi:hypothetical protein
MKYLSLALPSLAAAAVLIRQDNPNQDKCCFTLNAIGTLQGSVRENTIGELRLSGPFRQGFFCLNTKTGTIQDGVENNCFVRAPSLQFQCFQGVPFNSNKFAFATTAPATGTGAAVDPNIYLTLDGGDTFLACPSPNGDDSHNIFGGTKSDKTGCKEVRLVQTQPAGTCAATITVPARSPPL